MKTIYSKYILVAAFLVSIRLTAQVPYPAGPQQKPILVSGGTIHVGNGQVIENGAVAFEAGKLTYVGPASSAPADKSKYDLIDATGKQLYPGLILLNSQLGLEEISAVRATIDFDEQGDYNPNVRSLISYNTDSELIPTMRFNGILLTETTPSGGVISGTSSVMQLEGWNWEDAVYSKDVAIHMNWPTMQKEKPDPDTGAVAFELNPDYKKNMEAFNLFFNDAISYSRLDAKETNLKMEAMQGLFSGSTALMIHANFPKEIIDGVKFAQSHGVKRIVVLANEQSLKVVSFLKENNIPVIVPLVHNQPSRDDDPVDIAYALPGLLTKGGVMVSLSHDGMLANSRNLPFYAGTAAAFGMDKEEALKTVTANPAEILGIDKTTGTLEAGKDATLFISAGDALDFRGNNVSDAFIVGKRVTLNSKQQELYDRYSKKYGHKK